MGGGELRFEEGGEMVMRRRGRRGIREQKTDSWPLKGHCLSGFLHAAYFCSVFSFNVIAHYSGVFHSNKSFLSVSVCGPFTPKRFI